MLVTFQIHHGGQWHDAGEIEFEQPQFGYEGPSIVSYDLDYFTDFGALDYAHDNAVVDHRAVTVMHPIDLENRHSKKWPAFLLDLMPQGHARTKLAKHLNIDPDARSSDIPLLMRAAGSTIGNIRIKEAAEAETRRLSETLGIGVSLEEILERSDRFLEIVDRHAMIASGSSGLQGEWPKVAMTMAADGLYYPDPFVRDDEAARHVIVKMQRGGSEADRLILESEALYSDIAARIGLNVREVSSFGNGILVIPRFDRRAARGYGTVRIGQESMVSAIGVAEFGHVESHERYIEVLKRFSGDPYADVMEYLKRDMANLALGNPDNHGRNTSISKEDDGTIRLSPLFDFTPMKLAQESIPRSARWACMRDAGRDHSPDWETVCGVVSDGEFDTSEMMAELRQFAENLAKAPDIAADAGADHRVIDFAMARCSEITEPLLASPGRRLGR
jgi:serine/threonine-protein kinase HipA